LPLVLFGFGDGDFFGGGIDTGENCGCGVDVGRHAGLSGNVCKKQGCKGGENKQEFFHGVYLSFGENKQGNQAGKSSIRRMVYVGIYNQTVKELCGAVAIILIHKHIFKNLVCYGGCFFG
jgi:hypothetical protein